MHNTGKSSIRYIVGMIGMIGASLVRFSFDFWPLLYAKVRIMDL